MKQPHEKARPVTRTKERSSKETSPLLKNDNNKQSQHHKSFNETPSMQIYLASQSPSQRNTFSSNIRTSSMDIDEIVYSSNKKSKGSQIFNTKDLPSKNKIISISDKISLCIGRFLASNKKFIGLTSRLFDWLLLTSILGTVFLICIWLVNNYNPNTIFDNGILISNSAPLLICANIAMMFSYSLENFLQLRLCLSCGCALFATWGLTLGELDTFMFNLVMCLLNIRHAVRLLYVQRHVEFNKEWEQIYCCVFAPYLKRTDFQKLVNISYKRSVKKDDVFKAKGDEITSLCCLVKGRICVVRELKYEALERFEHLRADSLSNNGTNNVNNGHNNNGSTHSSGSGSVTVNKSRQERNMIERQLIRDDHDEMDYFLRNKHFVNLVRSNEFIEAPQWVSANLKPNGHRFNVSFIAIEDAEYIKWPKENLMSLIEDNKDIFTAIQAALGVNTAQAMLRSKAYNKKQSELFELASTRYHNHLNHLKQTRFHYQKKDPHDNKVVVVDRGEEDNDNDKNNQDDEKSNAVTDHDDD